MIYERYWMWGERNISQSNNKKKTQKKGLEIKRGRKNK